MSKNKLIIVMASSLSRSGGGRETWLSNFINNESVLNYYNNIVILSNEADNDNCINFEKKIKIIECKQKFSSKLISFVYHVRQFFRNSSNNIDEDTHIIYVGSWVELLCSFFNRKIKAKEICWVRSITNKELYRIYPSILMPFCRFLEIYLLRRMDLVITNGYDTSKYYSDVGIENQVIPNAINWDFNHSIINYNEDNYKLLYCGRLSSEKGVWILFEALALLYEKKILVEVDFYGCATEDVKNFIYTSNLNINYMGEADPKNIVDLLSSYDTSFHLTLSGKLGGGGISHSLIESMSAGHIIICWDSAIYNQINGCDKFLLANEPNALSLSNKILEACKLTTLEKEIIRNSTIESSKVYSFSEHVNRYFKVISGLDYD